jgi:DNA-binding MarR family transcriptional regulator
VVISDAARTTSTDESRAAVRTLARLARLLEHACQELTLPQYRLLTMVASGDERASQLAGRLALSKPTVTAAVDGLVERGLLARSEVAADRRVVRLTLTPAGRTALATTEVAMAAPLARLLPRCEDPGLVMVALGQLSRAMEAAFADRMAEGAR